MFGQQNPEDEAKKQALEELMKFAKSKMSEEQRSRMGDAEGANEPGGDNADEEGGEPIPGAETDGDTCDGADGGEAGPDGMCTKCGKPMPEPGTEGAAPGKPSPEVLKMVLAKMKAGQGA